MRTIEMGDRKLQVEIGKRISEVRVKKGYSREKLAEMAGISPKFLYEVETGKKFLDRTISIIYVLHWIQVQIIFYLEIKK